jgi:hypothetical protein
MNTGSGTGSGLHRNSNWRSRWRMTPTWLDEPALPVQSACLVKEGLLVVRRLSKPSGHQESVVSSLQDYRQSRGSGRAGLAPRVGREVVDLIEKVGPLALDLG